MFRTGHLGWPAAPSTPPRRNGLPGERALVLPEKALGVSAPRWWPSFLAQGVIALRHALVGVPVHG
jgi:hypothetical protein